MATLVAVVVMSVCAVSADAVTGRSQIPMHMRLAFDSLLEEQGIDRHDRDGKIKQLLDNVHLNLDADKEKILSKFAADKKELEESLQAELAKESEATAAVRVKKEASAKLVEQETARMDAAVKVFTTARTNLDIASRAHKAARSQWAKRKAQMLKSVEDKFQEEQGEAKAMKAMAGQVKEMVEEMTDPKKKCKDCKGASGASTTPADMAKIEQATKSAVCSESVVVKETLKFTECVKEHQAKADLCGLCNKVYVGARVAGAPCGGNIEFMSSEFMTQFTRETKQWQTDCPKTCACGNDFEPVCGKDGQVIREAGETVKRLGGEEGKGKQRKSPHTRPTPRSHHHDPP